MIKTLAKIALLSAAAFIMPGQAMAYTSLDFTVTANSPTFVGPLPGIFLNRYYSGSGFIDFTSTLGNGVYGLADIADFSLDLQFGVLPTNPPGTPYQTADFHFALADLSSFSLTIVGGTPTAASFALTPVASWQHSSSFFNPAAQSIEFVAGGDNGVSFFAWPGGVKTLNAVGDLDGELHEMTSAVPEPASWALMIGGLGLAGAAMRRRAKVAYA